MDFGEIAVRVADVPGAAEGVGSLREVRGRLSRCDYYYY